MTHLCIFPDLEPHPGWTIGLRQNAGEGKCRLVANAPLVDPEHWLPRLILNGSLALNLGDDQRTSTDAHPINFLGRPALLVPIFTAYSGTGLPPQRAAHRNGRLGTHEAAWSASLHPRQADRLWAGLSRRPGCCRRASSLGSSSRCRRQVSIPGFTGAIGLSILNLLFYLTLTLMLATLFNSRAPGLGISLGIACTGPLQIPCRTDREVRVLAGDIFPGG